MLVNSAPCLSKTEAYELGYFFRFSLMLRRFFSLILLLALFAGKANAQLFYSGTEYGIILGGSQYFGDLNDHYGFKFIRPVGGIFLRQHLNPYISVRGNLSYTKLGYADRLSDNAYNRMRNLDFKTDIVELSVQSEFNFRRFATGEDGRRITPYLTGGIGVFYYNPYTEWNGKRYYLRKLGTEGQNLPGYDIRKYHSFSVCFPIGIGFKYWIRPGFNLGFEVADRLTLTDYLDDVSRTYIGTQNFPENNPNYPNPALHLQDRSPEVLGPNQEPLGRAYKQRGNSQTTDQYLYGIITLSFQFRVYRCPGYLQNDFIEE